MTTFNDREKSFEKKFAMDEELKFKAESRRNRLLGQWAAGKLGLSGTAVDDYVKAVRKADLAQMGDDDVFRRSEGPEGQGPQRHRQRAAPAMNEIPLPQPCNGSGRGQGIKPAYPQPPFGLGRQHPARASDGRTCRRYMPNGKKYSVSMIERPCANAVLSEGQFSQ
jgi:hypothetical protein